MQLKEIMTREVTSIRPDAPLSEAIDKLSRLEGEPLPVYEGDNLVGMLTEHDIIEWNSRGGRDTRLAQVRDVMERDVLYCYEDQDVEDAARLIKEKRGQGLLVVHRDGDRTRNQQPVGTVSLADLALRREVGVRPTAETVSQPTIREQREPISTPRVFLQPIAPPSILGLFGLAGATFMVGAHWANWFTGNAVYLFPFAAIFGGVAQFLAGMWAFKARDGLATAIHGTWGSFWMGFGLLQLLFATGSLSVPTPAFAEFGYWFIPLAAITLVGTVASLGHSLAFASVLGTLTIACILAAYGYISGNAGIIPYAGGFLVISSILAWYTGGAMLINQAFRRTILPLFRHGKDYELFGRHARENEGKHTGYDYDYNEPGVRMGQ